MIERIAHTVPESIGPFQEFFPATAVARNKALIDAVGTHGTPFIVIDAQPRLRDVCKHIVFGYLSGIQVVVIVDYRLRRRIFLIQFDREIGFEQKIIFYHSF
jgi:hypothetical protein